MSAWFILGLVCLAPFVIFGLKILYVLILGLLGFEDV